MNKQNIIIIGATSGIGKALFEKYAADCNKHSSRNMQPIATALAS